MAELVTSSSSSSSPPLDPSLPPAGGVVPLPAEKQCFTRVEWPENFVDEGQMSSGGRASVRKSSRFSNSSTETIQENGQRRSRSLSGQVGASGHGEVAVKSAEGAGGRGHDGVKSAASQGAGGRGHDGRTFATADNEIAVIVSNEETSPLLPEKNTSAARPPKSDVVPRSTPRPLPSTKNNSNSPRRPAMPAARAENRVASNGRQSPRLMGPANITNPVSAGRPLLKRGGDEDKVKSLKIRIGKTPENNPAASQVARCYSRIEWGVVAMWSGLVLLLSAVAILSIQAYISQRDQAQVSAHFRRTLALHSAAAENLKQDLMAVSQQAEILQRNADEMTAHIDQLEKNTERQLRESTQEITARVDLSEKHTERQLRESTQEITARVDVSEKKTERQLRESTQEITARVDLSEKNTERKLRESTQEITGRVDGLEATTRATAENAERQLRASTQELTGRVDQLQASTRASAENTERQLRESTQELTARVDQAGKNTERQLRDSMQEITARVDQAGKNTERQLRESTQEITARVDQAEKNTERQIRESAEEITARVDQAEKNTERQVREGTEEIAARVDQAEKNTERQVREGTEEITARVDQAEKNTERQVREGTAALDTKLEKILAGQAEAREKDQAERAEEKKRQEEQHQRIIDLLQNRP